MGDRTRAAGGIAIPTLLAILPLLAIPAPFATPTTAGWARPHTELESSEPEDGSVVEAPPTAITLTFTTEVQLAPSSVTVWSADTYGGAVPAGRLAHLADDRRDVLVLPLRRPPAPGGYVVAWTTAGPDGHAVAGEFGFRVDSPVPGDAGVPGTGATEGDSAEPPGREAAGGGVRPGAEGPLDRAVWVRLLFHGGVVALLGAVAFRLLVLRRCARAGESREVVAIAEMRLQTVVACGTGALLATLPARLWYQAAALFPGGVAENLRTLLTGTAWALGWWLQLALVLLIGGAIRFRRPPAGRKRAWTAIAFGALLLPVASVLSGHGWTDAPRPLVAVATYLHVLAAGGWMGGLLCLVWAGLPALRARGGEEPGAPGLAGMVGAFSRMAQVAVALLLVTGAIKAGIHIGALSELRTTAWGRSLLLKNGIVAGALALGFYNWRFVHPALADTPLPGLVRGPATVELLLGAAAVAVTSYLVAQPLR